MDFRINKYLVATSPAETLSRAPSLSHLPRPACTSHLQCVRLLSLPTDLHMAPPLGELELHWPGKRGASSAWVGRE